MTQKKTYRIHQINRQLREEIASVLLTEMQDEILRGLTVTEVRASRDLSNAVVFIAVHRDADHEQALESAQRASGYIRRILFGRLHLRTIPNLSFRYDDSLDKAERIFQHLHHLDIPPEDDNEDDEIE
ncbi:MAG: 30S ribosome-binding factor RbfA [Candidatus Hinthialibacter antarcticus]|nr:30S ribosome-binding factor RbfA [Candidatus Hinthialibacter antarcticus]